MDGMSEDVSPPPAKKVLDEFHRHDLEDEFFKNCEALESKAADIIKLEEKLLYLESRYAKFSKEKAGMPVGAVTTKPKVQNFQFTTKELQDQITSLEQRIIQKQANCEKLANQVQYFRRMKNINPPETFAEMIDIANELFQKRALPNLMNQLRATMAILQSNYSGAEGPLRPLIESIGETMSLAESFKRKNAIRERETRVEGMRAHFIELQKKYLKMEQIRSQMQDKAEDNNQKNSKKTERISELQRRVETKHIEASKAKELEFVAANLQKEIAKLKKQKESLLSQSDNQLVQYTNLVHQELEESRAAVKSMEKRCEQMEKENSQLELRINDKQEELTKMKEKRDKEENQFRTYQSEYKEIMSVFGKLMENTDKDPFDDPKFLEYLSEVKSKKYIPQKADEINTKINEADKLIASLNEAIEKNIKKQDEITQRIENKRVVIQDLDQKLRSMNADFVYILTSRKSEGTTNQQEYTKGAKNIQFTQEEINSIPKDKNAIIVLFKNFQLLPEFIGGKPSQIFLVIDFLEQHSMMTAPVDPKKGVFNERLMFVAQNDRFLKDYIEKTAIPFQLCRSRESQITETGASELILSPFVKGRLKEFTSSTKIWNAQGQAVGKIFFESAVLKDLVDH